MSNERISDKHPAELSEEQNVTFSDDDDFRTWLLKRAAQTPTYLLAHADDGVIWGRIDAAEDDPSGTSRLLLISRNAVSDGQAAGMPDLTLVTLWELRLFSSRRETHLWRTSRGWRFRHIADLDSPNNATWQESFDEKHILWGTDATSADAGFTVLTHGAEGLEHVVPLRCRVDRAPLKLRVRHYLNRQGMARVVASRLVEFVQE